MLYIVVARDSLVHCHAILHARRECVVVASYLHLVIHVQEPLCRLSLHCAMDVVRLYYLLSYMCVCSGRSTGIPFFTDVTDENQCDLMSLVSTFEALSKPASV